MVCIIKEAKDVDKCLTDFLAKKQFATKPELIEQIVQDCGISVCSADRRVRKADLLSQRAYRRNQRGNFLEIYYTQDFEDASVIIPKEMCYYLQASLEPICEKYCDKYQFCKKKLAELSK